MVVPNRFHRLDAMFYKERYPTIQVVCPSVARERVEEIVPVDGDAEEVLPNLGIRCHVPRGTKSFELTYELDLSPGSALVFTDVLFNLEHLPTLTGWILCLLGSTGFFGTTRIWRFLFLKDKEAFKQWLLEAAETRNLRLICVGHGSPIQDNCAERLREASR